ncbi:MAG: hypothetical protein ACJZ89_06400 [Paracoccaceae bacterium]
MNKLFRNEISLRKPNEVMRLNRMGSMFPSRMSFMRTLLRVLSQKKAKVNRLRWDIDTAGYGIAVYSIIISEEIYSLVAFSTRLDPSKRTDRVIAEAWDSSYVLYDGIPERSEIDRLEKQVPLQEAGRYTDRDLILSRANKSVRLWSHVVERLKNGEQPDLEMIKSTGYLMRTTAVYGNGKFGILDRNQILDRQALSGPFMAEMLTVLLIRGFTHDLVEHVGRGELDKKYKKYLGIGNSTGLGMAPFLVEHPELISNWMMAKETGLARVRAISQLKKIQIKNLITLSKRVTLHLEQWNVSDIEYQIRIQKLKSEWKKICIKLPLLLNDLSPLNSLVEYSKSFSLDCQELLVSFVLEECGDVVDGLTCCMVSDYSLPLSPTMSLEKFKQIIITKFQWALAVDFEDKMEAAQFWYVSEEKLEPRLGLRFEEPGAELESPMDIARQIKNLYSDIDQEYKNLAEFLRIFPEHRAAVRRVQVMALYPYSEIQENLISSNCKPIDMLRCKLSFFGAAKFDPKSDRWVRIALGQGAPLLSELTEKDESWLPVLIT